MTVASSDGRMVDKFPELYIRRVGRVRTPLAHKQREHCPVFANSYGARANVGRTYSQSLRQLDERIDRQHGRYSISHPGWVCRTPAAAIP
jgi:hypothetical protein